MTTEPREGRARVGVPVQSAAAACLLLVLGLTAPARAQQEPPPPAGEAAEPAEGQEGASEGASLSEEAAALAARADELQAELRTQAEELRRLADEAEDARGEEKRVLQHASADQALEALETLRALVENLLAQEELGEADTSAMRESLEASVPRVAGRLVDGLAKAQEEVDELREARDDVEAADDGEATDLAEANDDLTLARSRLESLYDGMAEHLETMALLGVDTEETRRTVLEALDDRASAVAARLRLSLTRRELLASRATEAPDDESLANARAALAARVESQAETLRTVVDRIADLDGEGTVQLSDYRTLLLDASGEITTDLLDGQVAVGLTQRWLEQAQDWFAEQGPTVLFKVLLFLTILLVARLLASVTRRVVRATLMRTPGRSKLLLDTAVSISGFLVFAFGFLIALSQIGVEIGPVLAGLGIAGFVIGFALQDSLGNFAAGAMILFYRPFDVDDVVEVGGAFGKVSRMNLVATTLLTFDNQTIIVPNRKIWGENIRNLTAEPIRRVDLVFGVSYGDDVPKVEAVIAEVLGRFEEILPEPEPLVKVDSLGDSSVNFMVRPWVKTEDYWAVYWGLTREMYLAFGEAGISIPFPQRDVHLYPAEAATPGAAPAQAASAGDAPVGPAEPTRSLREGEQPYASAPSELDDDGGEEGEES
ncbi:MAG: mechanosensitive ion channel domain-containing protein [Sandaracinaceae bacterium]